jgi:hypothetical protein
LYRSVGVEFCQTRSRYLITSFSDVFWAEEELCRQVRDLDWFWVVERNGFNTGKADVFGYNKSKTKLRTTKT